jgi:hypothetical protein
MQYEPACDRIREHIATLLLELRPPTLVAAYAAACATQDLASAFHHAAGIPNDPLWREAVASLERFLALCARSTRLDSASALRDLRTFVAENGDVLRPRRQLAWAS